MGALKQPCAICGTREATTRDHVPPRAIFTKPLPSRLITVPACAECNNGAAGLDEEFRVNLGLVIGHKNVQATRLWKERSLATIDRNVRLARTIRGSIGSCRLYTGAGSYLGSLPAVPWPADRFHVVIERIARGLYFHHFKEILGHRVDCSVNLLRGLTKDFLDSTAGWPTDNIGDGVFVYRYGRAHDSPLDSFWVFQFYQVLWASVATERTNP